MVGRDFGILSLLFENHGLGSALLVTPTEKHWGTTTAFENGYTSET